MSSCTVQRRASSKVILKVGNLGAHLVLIIVSLMALGPIVWMYCGSFKTFNELVQVPPRLLPAHPTLSNFQRILFEINFIRGFVNSTIQAVVVTLAVLVTSAAAGYVFAKYHFLGKEVLFMLLLSTMMVPFAVVIVPLYVIISGMHLNDSLWGLIVPGLCSTFGIFMLRQFLESVPNDLIDAGRIDGASEFRIFRQVVLPLAGAPIASLAVFTFMGNWDSFLWPLVVVSKPQARTLPLLLAGLQSFYWTAYELYAAGAVVTITPVLILYALAQRQFIRGIAMTGLKA